MGAGFALRKGSLALTTHVILPEQKTAALSFLSGDERDLRDTVTSAEGAEEVQDRIKAGDGWVFVQAMQGKRPVVHVLIDAGMTPPGARNLPLTDLGMKLVFSRLKDGSPKEPFSTSVRWQPAFIAEMNGGKVSQVMSLDHHLFIGNPVMPLF
jgi:hypothetical protein